MIGREACFYNCMEIREISRLADLILEREQNNFNTPCNRRQKGNFRSKQTNEDRATVRVDVVLS